MFSSTFSITVRMASILIILLLALSLNTNTFLYQAIFVGLLFSHFFYGLLYSKKNAIQLKQNKMAIILAIALICLGFYFYFYMSKIAPYLIVLHFALSDAYLLPIKTKKKNEERVKLIRSLLYLICFGLLSLSFSTTTNVILYSVGFLSIIAIVLLTVEKKALLFFELPLVAIVIYTELNNIFLGITFVAFYHILTWYVFSFWMLFIKEKNVKKGSYFFARICLLSIVFIILFHSLNYSITDSSFSKIITFWSIFHVATSLSLSKFNPQFIKNLFYPTQKKVG